MMNLIKCPDDLVQEYLITGSVKLRNKIAHYFEPFYKRLVRKYSFLPFLDNDDLYVLAYEGGLIGVERFRKGVSCSLSTVVYARARGNILDNVRYMSRKLKDSCGRYPLMFDSYVLRFLDTPNLMVESSEELYFESNYIIDLIPKFYNTLDKEEKLFFDLYYRRTLPNYKIAEITKYSRSSVTVKIKKLDQKIKKFFK